MEDSKLGKFRLFRIMAKIGCIGFGGGNALIPVMQKELVEETKAVKSEDFDEDVVVASITPGALPVEIAGGIGSRLYGWQGMLIGSMGMAFPGVLFTLIFLSFLSGLDQNIARQIRFLTVGISAYIVCLLMDYVVSTLHREKSVSGMARAWLIIGIVFLLTCGKTLYRLMEISSPPMFGLATIHVFAVAFFLIFYLHNRQSFWQQAIAAGLCISYILCVGKGAFLHIPLMFHITGIIMLILAINGLRHSISEGNTWSISSISIPKNEILALVAMTVIFTLPSLWISSHTLIYVGSGILSSLMSFGGGDAYLTVADGLFVETSLISEDEFYGVIVPLVNLLPGSILCKTLTSVGYFIGQDESRLGYYGAYLIAFSGFVASVAASCGVFILVRCVYQKFQQLEIFQTVSQVIRPIVSGLLLTVALALFYQAKKLGTAEGMGWEPSELMLMLSVINGYLYFNKRIENIKVLLISCSISMIVCNFLS